VTGLVYYGGCGLERKNKNQSGQACTSAPIHPAAKSVRPTTLLRRANNGAAAKQQPGGRKRHLIPNYTCNYSATKHYLEQKKRPPHPLPPPPSRPRPPAPAPHPSPRRPGHPDADGVVVGGGGQHVRIPGVPRRRVDGAGVALQVQQAVAAVAVPDVDLRLFSWSSAGLVAWDRVVCAGVSAGLVAWDRVVWVGEGFGSGGAWVLRNGMGSDPPPSHPPRSPRSRAPQTRPPRPQTRYAARSAPGGPRLRCTPAWGRRGVCPGGPRLVGCGVVRCWSCVGWCGGWVF